MTNKKRLIIATITVAVILLFLSLILPGGMSLTIRDRNGTAYFEKSVQPGDVISFEFTHSVEHVQIVDNLLVQPDGSLLLTNETFDSSGYGIPSETFYNITVENGNFTRNNINQSFEGINFMTGSLPKQYLTVAGEKYPIYSSVPEAKPLFLSVEHDTLAEIVFNKIKGYI
jgi:hypothetical protein